MPDCSHAFNEEGRGGGGEGGGGSVALRMAQNEGTGAWDLTGELRRRGLMGKQSTSCMPFSNDSLIPHIIQAPWVARAALHPKDDGPQVSIYTFLNV